VRSRTSAATTVSTAGGRELPRRAPVFPVRPPGGVSMYPLPAAGNRFPSQRYEAADAPELGAAYDSQTGQTTLAAQDVASPISEVLERSNLPSHQRYPTSLLASRHPDVRNAKPTDWTLSSSTARGGQTRPESSSHPPPSGDRADPQVPERSAPLRARRRQLARSQSCITRSPRAANLRRPSAKENAGSAKPRRRRPVQKPLQPGSPPLVI
jgi:hypothetical protein